MVELLREDVAVLTLRPAVQVRQDLRKTEETHRDDREAQRRRSSSGKPKLKRAMPEFTSVPDDAQQQPEEDHRDCLQHRAMRKHRGSDQPHHHQREVFGRTELERDFGERGPNCAIRMVPTLPAMNDAIAAMASAGPARP